MVEKLIEDTVTLEPGDIQKGDYIRRPQAETEERPEQAGMVVSDLESAGYTYIYDTLSREASLCNNNMLANQRALRRPDGTLVFTLDKPAVPPWRGSIRCFLHQEGPDRALYDSMGFPVCRKATLPNQFQADNHARNKHRDEWNAVLAMRESADKAEERAAQRAIVKAMTGGNVEVLPPSPAAPIDVLPATAESNTSGPRGVPQHTVEMKKVGKRHYGDCSCGVRFWSPTEAQVLVKAKAHEEGHSVNGDFKEPIADMVPADAG